MTAEYNAILQSQKIIIIEIIHEIKVLFVIFRDNNEFMKITLIAEVVSGV